MLYNLLLIAIGSIIGLLVAKYIDKNNEKIFIITGIVLLCIYLYSLNQQPSSKIENLEVQINNEEEKINEAPILTIGGNRNQAVPEKEITLYYALWCPLSKDFLPVWEQFVEKAQTQYPDLTITQIRCEGGNERMCIQKEVPGYPYVTFEKNGNKHVFEEYPRTLDKLESFVSKLI